MATCQGQRISPESYAFFMVNMDDGTTAIKFESFVHQGLTTKETRNEVKIKIKQQEERKPHQLISNIE